MKRCGCSRGGIGGRWTGILLNLRLEEVTVAVEADVDLLRAVMPGLTTIGFVTGA